MQPLAHVCPYLRWIYVPLLAWRWPRRLRVALTLSPGEARALAGELLRLADEMEQAEGGRREANTREAEPCATPANACGTRTAA